jgi:hypothetical protein
VLFMQCAIHLVFVNHKNGGRRDRGRGCHVCRLAREATFPDEIARPKDRYHRFLASHIDDGKSYAVFLYVHDTLRGIALREDGVFSLKLDDLLP